MPEQVASPEQSLPTSTIDPAIKAELDQAMAISLNGGAAPAAAAAAEPAPTAATPAEPVAPAAPSDPFGLFKEKFGYESPEAAVQDIEALRAFRAAPPQPEWKFENEQSKKVAEALQAGHLKEVYEVLDQHMKIDQLTAGELTQETAAEVVKMGMQLKFKDHGLTPAEINYKFNKQFGLPPKPALLPAEDQEEFNERMKEWEAIAADKQMELLIEAKTIRPDLLTAKSKLVFPSISQPQDAGYLEWQKIVQENERLAGETTQAYKAFTPKSLETRLNFVDKENKVEFEFTYEPDPEGFAKAQEMVFDVNNLWKHFINSDGTPDRQRFFRFIHNGLNHDKIVMEAMKQAKNATIKASLPDNTTGGLVRQLPQTQEPNQLDVLMRESLRGYGGF